MTLYGYWRSTTTYRVRAALNLKGIAFETIPVDLLSGQQAACDYVAVNPGKCVPTLVLDDGTVLTQSLAILDYLDAVYPEPPLLPADPLARARVLAAAHTVALEIHPLNNLRVVQHLEGGHGAGKEHNISDWMVHWMREGMKVLETMISDEGAFSFGAAPDLADICLTAQMYNAHRWAVDLAPFPKIQRVEQACLSVAAIAAAHPDNQPDAKGLS